MKGAIALKKRDVDMTEGSIVRHLIYFALPLLAGNIFQQLYNTVDTWVVGNYVSNEAFSAVGTVGPIINMLIGFFTGLANGAGVVISQNYGARRYDKVQDTVHTTLVMTIVLGVLFTFLGIFLVPFMLNLMKVPAEVFPEASKYLTIYFAGIFGLMVYNVGAAILRAVGDSQRPFVFLVVSALVNTVLDLVFVLVFKMGVEGVAYATVIAQGISAVLVIITLIKSDNCVRFYPGKLKIHWDMLKKIIGVGMPAALQMAVTSFSNVFVQSYVNHFGADCMSGWTAFHKVDQLMFLPMQSIALSATTFVGQNLGKGKVDRAQSGIRSALGISIGATAVLLIPVLLFSSNITAFFNSKSEVVEYGTLFLRIIAPFHIFGCINQVLSGALRGAGKSRVPMFIMIISFVLFRQLYLFIMANYISNTFIPIALGYPAGWILCSLITIIYYKKTSLTSTNLVD